MSGRKIELDDVVEPLPQPVISAAQKDVSVTPMSVEEEANDSDHEVSDQVTIEPHRSTRIRTTPEWTSPLFGPRGRHWDVISR